MTMLPARTMTTTRRRNSAVAALVLAAGAAHATPGSLSVAELFHDATTIAVVELVGNHHGKVLESIRGPARGQQIDVQLDGGGQALVVCAPDDCVADRDRGGYFVLGVGNRMRMIALATILPPLTPGIVERRSLTALAAGSPAPSLCLEAKVHFTETADADADLTLRGELSAADGAGTLRGGPRPMTATLWALDQTVVEHGAHNTARLALQPFRSFDSGPVTRGKDGCYRVTLTAANPSALTP
jgi:hypothetical protein